MNKKIPYIYKLFFTNYTFWKKKSILEKKNNYTFIPYFELFFFNNLHVCICMNFLRHP